MSSESVPTSSSSLSAPLPPLTRIAIIVVAVYAMVQLLADLASLKIGVVFGLAVDMGTFIYPITFTLRDLAHKVLGRKRARVLIITAAGMNFLAVLYLIACAAVPSDEGWGLGEQFSAIFTPIWRIVFAAVVAQVVSQLVNTEVYHWFATRVTRRHQWLRVLVSNSVAIPVDNIIFVLGAFAWAMPWSSVVDIYIFNLVLKMTVMVVSIPLVYVTKADVE
jgi:queuosine precursor transporter